MQRIHPRAAAAALDEYWSQGVVGEANGNLFKVAKGIGSTNWHKHDDRKLLGELAGCAWRALKLCFDSYLPRLGFRSPR